MPWATGDFWGDVIRKVARPSGTLPGGYSFEVTSSSSGGALSGSYASAVVSVSSTPADINVALGITPKLLYMTSMDDNAVYYGFTSAVDSSTGLQMFKDQPFAFEAFVGVPTIFLVRSSSTSNVRVWGAS